jgi:hypothetical protein
MDYKMDEDKQQCILRTNSNLNVLVTLFDRITVRITVGTSRAHFPPIQMSLVYFGIDSYPDPSTSPSSSSSSSLPSGGVPKDEKFKMKDLIDTVMKAKEKEEKEASLAYNTSTTSSSNQRLRTVEQLFAMWISNRVNGLDEVLVKKYRQPLEYSQSIYEFIGE